MTPKRIAPGFCQKASPSAALMVPQPAQNLLTAKILPALGGPIPSFLPDTPPNRPNGDRTESPATPKPARRKTRFCRKPPGGGERLEKTPASPSARRRHIAGFPLPPPTPVSKAFPVSRGHPARLSHHHEPVSALPPPPEAAVPRDGPPLPRPHSLSHRGGAEGSGRRRRRRRLSGLGLRRAPARPSAARAGAAPHWFSPRVPPTRPWADGCGASPP